MSDVRTHSATNAEVRPRPGGGQYPDYWLDEPEGRSFYGRYESGRDLDYYEADPNLRLVLEGRLEVETMRWAQERLGVLGERSGRVLVHQADETDEANHELVRYDRFGREVSEVRCHPNWTANLNEVFDFGLVGWNHDEGLLGRYGRALRDEADNSRDACLHPDRGLSGHSRTLRTARRLGRLLGGGLRRLPEGARPKLGPCRELGENEEQSW